VACRADCQTRLSGTGQSVSPEFLDDIVAAPLPVIERAFAHCNMSLY
jgi:hypothetical protein